MISSDNYLSFYSLDYLSIIIAFVLSNKCYLDSYKLLSLVFYSLYYSSIIMSYFYNSSNYYSSSIPRSPPFLASSRYTFSSETYFSSFYLSCAYKLNF